LSISALHSARRLPREGAVIKANPTAVRRRARRLKWGTSKERATRSLSACYQADVPNLFLGIDASLRPQPSTRCWGRLFEAALSRPRHLPAARQSRNRHHRDNQKLRKDCAPAERFIPEPHIRTLRLPDRFPAARFPRGKSGPSLLISFQLPAPPMGIPQTRAASLCRPSVTPATLVEGCQRPTRSI
jgi:hypothetical protein